MVDLGISMLADKGDDADRVMDFLMSKYSNLSQKEWEEVEDEITSYVDALESKTMPDSFREMIEGTRR